MPRYYLLVNDRPIKFSTALDQLKDFALTSCSSSVNLKIHEFGNSSYLQSSFHRYDRHIREWVRSDD